MLFLVNDNRLHFRRCHRIDDELGVVVIPQHDIDALAIELVRHRLHARAAHADAGTDRIGTMVMGKHGNLGAVAGIARAAFDLDQTLTYFGNFELEQLDHEFWCRPRDEKLRPARFRTHFVEIAAHTVTGAHGFARNRLVSRDVGFSIATEIDIQVAAFDALDDAGDQLADAIGVSFDDLRALGFPHSLHDDLLGRLCGDATKFGILDLLLDVFTDLAARFDVDSVHQANLPIRRFHDDIIGDHFPATESLVFARLLVDRNAREHFLGRIALLRGRSQGSFHRVEDDLLGDALLVGYRIDHQQ